MTSKEKLARIERTTDAFLYLVAHQGVTGVRARLAAGEVLRRVVAQCRLPVCLGFGLFRPEHLREAYSAGARIAVVGSYLAQVIGEAFFLAGSDPEARVVEAFLEALRALMGVQTC